MGGFENGALFAPDPWRDPEKRHEMASQAIKDRNWEALGALYEHYLTSLRNYQTETVVVYRRALEDFWAYAWNVLGRQGLHLSPTDITTWLQSLLANGIHVVHRGARRLSFEPLSPSTARIMLYGLRESRGFFAWLGHPLPEHVEWPRPPAQRLPRVLSEDEYRAFLSAARQTDPLGGMVIAIRLIGELALRLQEVQHITPVDIVDQGLNVRRQPYLIDRLVPLPTEIRRGLSAYVEKVLRLGFAERARVFLVQESRGRLTVISPRAFQSRMTAIARSAGLPPHYIRALRNRGAIQLYRRYGSREKVSKIMGLSLPPTVLKTDFWQGGSDTSRR